MAVNFKPIVPADELGRHDGLSRSYVFSTPDNDERLSHDYLGL
jgi:hypothetical protein